MDHAMSAQCDAAPRRKSATRRALPAPFKFKDSWGIPDKKSHEYVAHGSDNTLWAT